MALINTGLKGFARLAKVTNDGTNRPLDVNGRLIAGTPNAQHIKLNTPGQPDYIPLVQNLIACPLPIVVPPPSGYRQIYITNRNSSLVNNLITGVLVNGVDVTLDNGLIFPIHGNQTISGVYSASGNMTNAIVTVGTDTLSNRALRLIIDGNVICQTTSSVNNFSNINLSAGQDITVILEEEGTDCL